PYYPLRMCGWCGAIGHSSKNCHIRKSGRPRVDNNHKRALIQGLNKFKNTACGCCGNENHARNDPNAPCRNQNCINPRL
ncbi:2893_t:CDS:2, partial [Dentiscutata heterogama]